MLVGWLIETFASGARWMPVVCYVIAYFFGGYSRVLEAFEKLRSGEFEIDFLMIVAAMGAAI